MRDDQRRGRSQRPGFLLPFGHRRSLAGSSCARWGVGPSSRSACRTPHARPDPNGVVTSHTSETRPGWVPPRSRDGGALPADKESPAGACRFPTASPPPRCRNPSAGPKITRHHWGFTLFTRPVFPLPVALGWNKDPWASTPSSARRRHQQRTSGRGQALSTGPGLRPRPQHRSVLPSASPLATCDLVSHLLLLGIHAHHRLPLGQVDLRLLVEVANCASRSACWAPSKVLTVRCSR